jgi:hypothetical protein
MPTGCPRQESSGAGRHGQTATASRLVRR